MTSPALAFTVLIVEDDDRLAYSIRQLVEAEGWLALSAPSVERAQLLLATQPADVAVVDLTLPDRSGLELIEAMSATGGAPAFIAISGQATVQAAVRAMRSGATDFLQKPFGAPEFVIAVQRAIQRHHLASALEIHERAAELLDASAISDLARRAVGLGMQLVPADRVSLLLPPAGSRFVLVMAQGNDVVEEVAPRRLDSVGARVMADGEAALIQGPTSGDPRFSDLPSSDQVDSAIVVPLRSHGATHGLLTFGRGVGKRAFGSTDLHRARVLGAQTALAFHQLRSREHVASLERLAALGELMASVAHELNNPISFVSSNVGFALDLVRELAATPGPDSARALEARDALEDAQEGASRVVALVRDMKGLSRADEGHTEVFEIAEPIRAATRLAGAELTSVQLAVDVPEGLHVRGNAGRLSQVFVNLFVNAAQATEAMEPGRRAVRVTAKADRDEVIVAVEDSGPGVTATVAARIFEPFFSTKTGRGTGLGLPISRDIVRKFGGELALDETYTAGARFVVRLPKA